MSRATGSGSWLSALTGSEMPLLFAVCRENGDSREKDGRAGWNAAEWQRFIDAARDPQAHAAKDGLVVHLLGTALLRTVKAVETMRGDGFSDEKIRQTLVLRKQHESNLVDEQRARMNARTEPMATGPRRRRAPQEDES